MITVMFWTAVAVVLYTYIGYPVLMFFLAKLFKKDINKSPYQPTVSIVISVFNEEKNIARKIKNCLEIDYPKDKIELLIGSDGSYDNTESIIKKQFIDAIKFFKHETPRGKVSMLNTLLSHTESDIIVFTDARQELPSDTVKKLVAYFADNRIGSVSGELIMKGDKKGSVSEGINIYWRYEKFIREHESLFRSMLGATGALYAIRRSLFKPMDDDILLDDMIIPLRIIKQGYRAVFAPEIEVYDVVAQDIIQENRRKIRTLCGNWQLLFRYPIFYIPLISPIGFQLLSHKISRLIIPWLLIFIFITNYLLIDQVFYQFLFLIQLGFYSLGILGYFFNKYHIRIFNIPYTFCALNWTALQSFFVYIFNTQKVTWKSK